MPTTVGIFIFISREFFHAQLFNKKEFAEQNGTQPYFVINPGFSPIRILAVFLPPKPYWIPLKVRGKVLSDAYIIKSKINFIYGFVF